MTTLNAKRYKKSALALVAAAAVTMASTSFAAGSAQAPVKSMDPYSEQALDRMAAELKLDASTKKKAGKLFAEAREDRQEVIEDLQELRKPMMQLNPVDKDYVDQVADLSEKRSDLMQTLEVQQAKTTHEFYALLTPQQVQMMQDRRK